MDTPQPTEFETGHEANGYQVSLQFFEGPLDLLLHLIRKHEVDIYDIPIATITHEYLGYLELMQRLNLEVAGSFLEMAATLTYIKSRTLLPEPPAEEGEEGIDPEQAFELLEALQRAFYAEGRDITEEGTLRKIAEQSGFNGEDFVTLFRSDSMREQVVADRYKARAYGASSFPSLVVIDREGHLSVLRGYRTFGELERLLGI